MSTYYQYQNPSEIGAAPTLDWGSVAQNVNETLQKQEQIRYENREADKKLTNDILTKVSEVNLTSDPTFGELVTKMGFEAKDNQYNLFNKLYVQATKDKKEDRSYVIDLKKRNEDCLFYDTNKEVIIDKNISKIIER